jgi:nucleoside permease NupC
MEVFHAIVGTLLIAIAIAILFTTWRFDAGRGARTCAIIGFLAIISAAYGGISFVLSGFQNNGNSAQMGGSFIGSYASYFLVLYFNKR